MTTFPIVPLRFLAVLIISWVLPLTLLGQAPSISTQPANVSAVSSLNAIMTVTANGSAPLAYQWRFYGANLSGRTNATLTITNLSITNGGVYTVVITNSSGSITSAPTLLNVDEHLTFRILQLQTNGAQAIECNTFTGQDRGGLVVSPEYAFLTGNNGTARFGAADLTGAASIGRIYDSLCGNLRTEQIYVMANGTNIITWNGGTVTALLELDRETGLPNGTRIILSTNISMFYGGIFSGYERVVLWNGSSIFDISLPSGRVTPRGSMNLGFQPFNAGWANWGIAEYFTNTLHLVYAENLVYPATNIARIRVGPGSVSTPVQGFSNLGDMANIAFSISRSRWYFHYEGLGQFRSGDETIGSAKALFNTNGGVPFIYLNPQSQVAFPGNTVTLNVTVLGNGPFSYQWRSNGVPINAPDSPSLVLSNVDLITTANYSVEIANAAGTVTSSDAFLFIAGAPQILVEPQTQSALAGTNMSFNVVVQAAPPISYQWLHYGTNIPNATNSTLAIPVVTTADVGDYIVIATNRYGSATSVVARLALIVESAFNFKILILSNDAVIAEHEGLTGADYAGIAVSSNRVFVTGLGQGSGATASFSADDLSGGTVLPGPLFALVTDLRAGRVYSLGDGTNLFITTPSMVVTTLIEINGTNGVPTTNIITLSLPIPMNSDAGLFSGYGQIVIHNGIHVYSIAVPSGVVADLGVLPNPPHQLSAGWAYWGLAENFGGSVYLAYVRNNISIVRTRVPDGLTTTIANFLNLADMASIGASASQGRWYFHHEGISQFGGTNQSVGFCSAAFSITANQVVDHFSWSLLPSAQFSGVPFAATITARTIDNTVVSNFSGRVSLVGVATADGAPVNVLPASSGNFTNGIWSGQLAVPEPSPGLMIRATDIGGRFGLSSVLSAITTNDLAVQLIPSTNAATLYAALTYHLFVTNTGPEASSTVVVTNVLPANINLISTDSSQGSCSVNGGTVVCDLGTMTSATSVAIDITVVPTALSTLTNTVRVARSAAEIHPENNSTVSVIPVAMPVITFSDASVLEGDSAASRGTNVFLVQLNTTSAVPVSVQFSTAPGTATNAGDYVTRSGLLVFQPGQTTTNIRVTIGADLVYEADEFYFVNFFNVTNALLVRTQAVGAILNDDAQPTLVASNVVVTEGNAGTALISFPVRLSAPSGVPISINYATSNGTAVVGSDYVGTSGLLYYGSGATNLFISVSILGDTIGESNEFFYVNFFNGTNINVNTQILVVINNDDPLTVDHFTFSPVAPTQFLNSPFPVTITARDYSNHVLTSFSSPVTLSGLGGAGEATVTIGGSTTTWYEPLYTYWHDSRTQVIYPPSELRNVQRIKSLALNVIRLPGQPLNSWTIRMKHTPKSDFSTGGFETTGWTVVYQGNISVTSTGWLAFEFSTPFDYNGVDNLMIDYSHNNSSYTTQGDVSARTVPTPRAGYYYCDSCQGNPLSWSGSSPGFYTSTVIPDIRLVTGGASLKISPSNNLSFTSGTWNGNVTVLEPGEPVRLQATDAAQHIGASDSFAVLLADDLALRVVPSANPAPTNQNLVYFITVSNAGPNSSTGVVLTNQLPPNATYVSSSTDHGSLSLNGGNVVANIGTLAGGEVVSLLIAVRPNGTGNLTNAAIVIQEQAEAYTGNNNQTNVVTAVGLALNVADATVVEGQSGTTNAVFNVSLTAASTQIVSVAYSSQNSSAVAGTDYQAVSGVLVFAPGITNLPVSVPVFGDVFNELNEQFLLNLSNATNAPISRASATNVIVNDDPLPMISVSDIAIAEGRTGFTPATFTLALSPASGRTVTVSVSTLDGTASFADYVPTNATIFFTPGQTTAQMTVLVRADGVAEPDEFFLLSLSSPINATLGAAEARATVVNDDSGVGGTLDHFEWSVVSSPQTINRAFNVTIAARDGLDTLLPFNGTVSLRALAGTNALTLLPTNSTAFVDGIWSGVLTLFNAAGNVVLVADDGAGHTGSSNPIDVNVADVALGVSAPPQVLIGSPFTCTISVTNFGPASATAIIVTNRLPIDAVFVSGNAAGGCALADGLVTCDVGVLTNGGRSTITVTVSPTRGGTLSNVFFVAAFEFDLAPANNVRGISTEITGDEDHDSLPDAWEAANGLSSSNPNDANLDSDGDGHTNLQEYIAGTDPWSAASVLKLTATIQAGNAQLRFRTVADRRYQVERAPAPGGPWSSVGGEIPGDGDLAILSDPDPVTDVQRFYRVQVMR